MGAPCKRAWQLIFCVHDIFHARCFLSELASIMNNECNYATIIDMGLLITVEGGEYVGKTSVAIPGLQQVLKRAGVAIISSREPGGTPEAEIIRKEIFEKHAEGASPKELTLLFNKARKVHLDQVIIPFLGIQKERNAVVLLDRYMDSTRVYQGLEGGVDMNDIYNLEQEYVKGYLPDITFICYIPEHTFEKTLEARRKSVSMGTERSQTEWDADTISKQLERQQNYMKVPEIAKHYNEQRSFYMVDASRHPFDVIYDLVVHTGSHIEKYHSLSPYRGVKGELLSSFNKLKKEPVWMYFEKQWKKQEQLMKSF